MENKITEEQDAKCKLSASYQTNEWSAKQRYKDCKKETKHTVETYDKKT